MILYHGAPNGFSLKALIALEEIGVGFESRPIDQVPLDHAVPGYPMATEQRISQEREGPVLIDGDAAITGSFFLLEYLGERFPDAGLLPADPLARYHAQAIGQTVANMIAPFVAELGVARYPVPAGDFAAIEPVERRAAWGGAVHGIDTSGHADRLRPTLQRFDRMLADAGGEWLLGRYSMADIDLFAMIRNLPDLVPGLIEETPGPVDFVARVAARPAVARALARGDADAGRVFTPGPEISRWG